MATSVSRVMSDQLYQAALAFGGSFTVEDITSLANAERRKIAQQWLDELVERGELIRLERTLTVKYRWVNW